MVPPSLLPQLVVFCFLVLFLFFLVSGLIFAALFAVRSAAL